MSRLLAGLLIAAGLTLITAPAHAEVRVTIHAARTALPAGESTDIRGLAVGARRGSVVKLQHKVSGTWRTVGKRRVWSTRQYSFRVSPPRGFQRYRIVMPWQSGQPRAVSPVLELAVLEVGMSADPTTLIEGESKSIRGKVFGVDPGSVLKLQRRVDDAWKTVEQQEVRSTRRYSFDVTPPRDHQRYRVVKPWRAGQPRVASPVRKLTVQWRPTLSASARFGEYWDGGRRIYVEGTVTDGPRSPILEFQRDNGTGWLTLESKALEPGTDFGFSDPDGVGAEFRVRLQPTALTTEETSPAFAYQVPHYVMELNTTLRASLPAPVATVAVDVEAGDYVSLHAYTNGAEFDGTVASPSGDSVATFGTYPDNLVRFTAPETGTYMLRLGDIDRDMYPFEVSLSTPKVVTTSVDAPEVSVVPDVPGQVVDVRFDTTDTPVFTIPYSSGYLTEPPRLLDPSGDVAQPWFSSGRRIYRSAGGTYTMRMSPSANYAWARPLSVTRHEGTVDGPNVEAVVDEPYRVVIIEFERPVEPVTVGVPSSSTWRSDVAVFDAVTGELDPTGPGRSVVVVSGTQENLVTVPVQLTTPLHIDTSVDGPPTDVDLTGSYRRTVVLHFHANNGDLLTLDDQNSDGFTGSWDSLPRLESDSGDAVPDLWRRPSAWVIPEGGAYTITVTAWNEVVGTIAVRRLDSITIPADGVPVTVDIDEPGELIVARVPVSPGAVIEARLDEVSSSLADDLNIDLKSPTNHLYIRWVHPGVVQLPVQEPGEILAMIWAANAGSVRMTFTPLS